MSEKSIAFNFPATRFVESDKGSEQIAHVLREADEVREALVDRDKQFVDVLEELADLEHCLETLWRMLTADVGEDVVLEVFELVREKNEARGYYQESDNDASC